MATTADSLTKVRKTDAEELPVSPAFSDLPSFRGAEAVEQLATETRWAREEVDATMSALRERITARHLSRFAMERMREVAARPGARTKVLLFFSGIVLLCSTAILVVPRLRRRDDGRSRDGQRRIR